MGYALAAVAGAAAPVLFAMSLAALEHVLVGGAFCGKQGCAAPGILRMMIGLPALTGVYFAPWVLAILGVGAMAILLGRGLGGLLPVASAGAVAGVLAVPAVSVVGIDVMSLKGVLWAAWCGIIHATAFWLALRLLRPSSFGA